MQQTEFQRLVEASWKRPITPGERGQLRDFLAAHPEFQEAWEDEAALSGMLRRMPTPAISSHFTARVLQAATRAEPQSGWRRRLGAISWLSNAWVPRAALGAAMICSGMLSFNQYQAMHRAQISHEVASAARLAELPRIDWLENFDTINRLNKVKVADDDLLTALQ